MIFDGFWVPTLGVSPLPTNQALEFTLGDIIGMLIKFQSGYAPPAIKFDW